MALYLVSDSYRNGSMNGEGYIDASYIYEAESYKDAAQQYLNCDHDDTYDSADVDLEVTKIGVIKTFDAVKEDWTLTEVGA